MRTDLYRYGLGLITLLACSLSLLLSFLFWSSNSNQGTMQWLFTCMGLVFELTKFLALPIAINFWQQKRYIGALSCLTMYTLFMAVSMFSGISVLQQSLMQQQKTKHSWQLLEQQIDLQQSKVYGLNKSANLDVKHGYRARAKETWQLVSLEQNRLQTMKEQLQKLSQENISLVGIPISADFSFAITIILGSLLEITIGFLLWLLSKIQVQTKAEIVPAEVQKNYVPEVIPCATRARYNPGTKNQVHQVHSRYKETVPEAQQVQSKSRYKEVKSQVQTGQLNPTVRAIKQLTKLGTDKACDLLKSLEQDGILFRKGKGYCLA